MIFHCLRSDSISASGPGACDKDWLSSVKFCKSAEGGKEPSLCSQGSHRINGCRSSSGNNRCDSLNNLIDDPRIALLFLIPGVGETLRVNGRAEICVDPALLERFPAQGKLPRSVIVVHVERVYFQCPKALVRSDLWNPAKHVDRKSLPSSGTILGDITRGKVGGAEYVAAYPERLKATIY